MSISSINLTQYDTVIAVTQNAINEALATYLYGMQKQVALCYTTNSQGDFIPATPDDATYTFTGTLDYTLDGNGNPVDMVVLRNQKGNQTVTYRVTFSQAEFRSKAPAFEVRQTDQPWIFQFDVSLALGPVAMDKLPTDVRHRVQSVVQNLGPDMFSIQQLYMDLNTAVLDTFVNVDGLNPLGQSLLAALLSTYVREQAVQGKILFGYSLSFTGSSSAPPPTFMPTSLDFVVTPYTDPSGNHRNPGLDTLNYLVMTGNRSPPAYPPASFPWNWVDDETVQGTLAVKHDLFVGLLVRQLSPVLRTVCPVLSVRADNSLEPISLDPGTDHEFEVVTPTSEGVVARYSYSSPGADEDWSLGSVRRVRSSYSSSTQIELSGSTITVSGSITISAEISESTTVQEVSSTSISSMPETTYRWSVPLRIQMDLTDNGQLNLIMGEGDLDSPPTVAEHEQSVWQAILSTLSGVFVRPVEDVSNLRSEVRTTLDKGVVPALTRALATMNAFVFPGARTFAFKNPQFSGALDLTSNITYLTPSDPATTAARNAEGVASEPTAGSARLA